MRKYLVFYLLTVFLLFAVSAVAQEPSCDDDDCSTVPSTINSSDNYDQNQPDTNTPGMSRQRIDTTGANLPTSTDQFGRQTQGMSDIELQNAIRRARGETQPLEQQKENPELNVCPGPKCPPLVREEKTEFQKFIYTTTGQRLSLYGHNLFSTSPTTFVAVQNGPVPADYLIGPGDELLIRASGQLDFSAKLTVDRNGQIFLPRVGTVSVAGVRYDEVTAHLKDAISRNFKNFDLNVTLGQLRSIQVFVVGQARRPGTYTISSLSTLMTALFAAGGPSATGSLRHIQLKRQKRLAADFDVYDLLAHGDKSKDPALLAGDVIYIPPVGKQVAVIGSINLPGIYEIDDKTSIRDEIQTAGGLSTTADGTRVIIERIDNRTTRSIEELKLDESGLSQNLSDGDVIHVFPISPHVQGSVILRGNVAVPGRFPWRAGMRIADLIPSKESMITRDYWMRQSMLARGDVGWQNPQTLDEDKVDDNKKRGDDKLKQERKQEELEDQRLRREKRWSDGPADENPVTLKRLPADINWDYAVIQRLNPQDLSSELITFSLGKALLDPASRDNVELQSGDVITIFSQQDLSVPENKRTKLVWIEGEVGAAGIYRAQPGETLRDLVIRAGGVTPSAYLFAAEFRRESTKQEQQKEMDRLVDSMERDLTTRARLVSNSLNAEDKVAGQQELQYERATITRLRAVQVTGRIVLDLKPTDTDVSAIPAMSLEDGDKFTVPPKPATIGVVGSVYNQNSFLYQPQNSVSHYLGYAGGGTRDADKGRLFILRANGSVVSKQMHRSLWSGSFENAKLYPGDAIVMPEKIKTTNVLKGLRDWSQVFAQFALGAAALKTISP